VFAAVPLEMRAEATAQTLLTSEVAWDMAVGVRTRGVLAVPVFEARNPSMDIKVSSDTPATIGPSVGLEIGLGVRSTASVSVKAATAVEFSASGRQCSWDWKVGEFSGAIAVGPLKLRTPPGSVSSHRLWTGCGASTFTPPGDSAKRLRVALALGSQSVSLAGVQLTVASTGHALFGTLPPLVASIGPWQSCSTLGKGGQNDPVALWPPGLRVQFGDLTNASTCTVSANQAVLSVSIDRRDWLISTDRGDFRVGDVLPAALASTASRRPAYSEAETLIGEVFGWPMQDACQPTSPLSTDRLSAIVGFDGRVAEVFAFTGSREPLCP
jgi:hypothetical protein